MSPLLLVVVPAMIAAVGSCLSAYIAVKVRATANKINGEVQQLQEMIAELELVRARLRARSSGPDS